MGEYKRRFKRVHKYTTWPMYHDYDKKPHMRRHKLRGGELDDLDEQFDKTDYAERKIGTKKVWD